MVPGPAQVERQLGERRQGRFRSEMLGHTVNYSLSLWIKLTYYGISAVYQRLAIRLSAAAGVSRSAGQTDERFSSRRLRVPGNCVADDLLGLLLNSLQMVPSLKTLVVNLVNVLSTRRSSREPSTRRNHFDAADWRAIAWCG